MCIRDRLEAPEHARAEVECLRRDLVGAADGVLDGAEEDAVGEAVHHHRRLRGVRLDDDVRVGVAEELAPRERARPDPVAAPDPDDRVGGRVEAPACSFLPCEWGGGR
eukprot:933402-Alexandrium_andersonii.AAC.1